MLTSIGKAQAPILLHGRGHLNIVITWISSYPRSGNDFFRLLLWWVFGREISSFYSANRGANVPEKLRMDFDDIPFEEQRTSERMFYAKTHELSGDDLPAVYLVRDGRDVYVSYAHFILQHHQEPPPGRYDEYFLKTLHELIRFEESFSGWRKHVATWTERKAPTAVVRFEELVRHAEPERLVAEALRSIGHDATPVSGRGSADLSFQELNRQFPKLYRKGKIGSHREEMPPRLEKLFWRKNKSVMKSMGYERQAH